eukprot:TRINITY_DN18610_c0_g1_i5.p1 TRINITY_DN18610_c0_g1~~TRINITY_DN18610_c0_g1_i5.p1  ORF type:complete len:178 (+),score=26.78 TRINITY_DN18610_c0_g1_i5:153-686(+)
MIQASQMGSFQESRRQPLVWPGFNLVLEDRKRDSKVLLPLSSLGKMRRCSSHGDLARHELVEALENKDDQGRSLSMRIAQGLKKTKDKLDAHRHRRASKLSNSRDDDPKSVCSVLYLFIYLSLFWREREREREREKKEEWSEGDEADAEESASLVVSGGSASEHQLRWLCKSLWLFV